LREKGRSIVHYEEGRERPSIRAIHRAGLGLRWGGEEQGDGIISKIWPRKDRLPGLEQAGRRGDEEGAHFLNRGSASPAVWKKDGAAIVAKLEGGKKYARRRRRKARSCKKSARCEEGRTSPEGDTRHAYAGNHSSSGRGGTRSTRHGAAKKTLRRKRGKIMKGNRAPTLSRQTLLFSWHLE